MNLLPSIYAASPIRGLFSHRGSVSTNANFRTAIAILCTSLPATLSADVSDPKKTDEVILLPEQIVRSDRLTPFSELDLDLARAEVSRVPGGVNFVLAEDYLRGRAANLKDALDYQPGVFVQSRFGSEEARVSIRGSGLQRTFHGRGLKLLQDGFSLTEADGGFDMQALEPLAYSGIQVWRGANALAYGSATLGGAINFLSPTGYDSPPARLRAEAGSHGSWRVYGSTAGVGEKLDHFVAFSHGKTDGYRDYSAQKSSRLFANLGAVWSDRTGTRFHLSAARSDSELPGSLTQGQMKSNPRTASPGNVLREDKRDFDYLRLSQRTTWFGPDDQTDFFASWAYKDLDHPIFNILTPTFATGPGTIALRTHNVEAVVHHERRADLAGRPNRLVAGAGVSFSRGDDDRFANITGPERGELFARGTERNANLELFAENDHQLTHGLQLVVGLHYATAWREFEDEFRADGDSSRDQDYDQFSPKLGLHFSLDDTTAFFGNLSRSFEAPSMGEIKGIAASAGPPVLPYRVPRIISQELSRQSATSVEIGTRGSRDRISWDVTVYHARLDGELLSLNDEFGSPLGTINAGDTVHQGVEAGLDLTLARGLFDLGGDEPDRLVLRQVYTWSRFRFDGDPVYRDNTLAGVPEHFYRAELAYEGARGFYAGLNLEYAGCTPIDHANTFFNESYTLLGARAGWRSVRGLSVFIDVRNLTDRVYAATTGVIADAGGTDSAQFLPADGRSWYLGAEYRW